MIGGRTGTAVTRPTTEGCADCPTPPAGALEVVVRALFLSALPLCGLAVGLPVAVAIRHRVAGPSGTYLGIGGVLVLLFVLAGQSISTVLTTGAALTGLAVGLVALICRTVPAESGTAGRMLPWLAASTLGVVALSLAGGAVSDLVGVLAGLGLLVPLSYPLGVALGRRDAGDEQLPLAGVLSAMGAAIVVAMSRLVPLGGGPAVLLVFIVAVLVVVVVLVASPLIALGEARTRSREPSPASR